MPHHIYELVIIDSRGRIVIPSRIRKILNISEGMYMMLIADPEKREVRITPLAEAYAKIYRIKIMMSDQPGVLAKVASLLADEGVDLFMSESRTIKRGVLAEWHVVADLSRCRDDVDKLIDKVRKLDFVRDVEVSEISVK